jgi:G protein-coupled receptor 157
MIIVTYFRWRHLQTTTRKLLVYLSVADYTFAACNVIGALRDENGPCNATVPARDGRILSVFGTLGSCCSYFWTVFLAVYLYIMIVKNNSYLAERIFPLFHIIGWGVPVIVIGLATYMDVLGCSQEEEITGGWCWVILQGKDNRGINVMWMLVTAKLWELLAYFVIFILYFKIKFHFKREVSWLFVYQSLSVSLSLCLYSIHFLAEAKARPIAHKSQLCICSVPRQEVDFHSNCFHPFEDVGDHTVLPLCC